MSKITEAFRIKLDTFKIRRKNMKIRKQKYAPIVNTR